MIIDHLPDIVLPSCAGPAALLEGREPAHSEATESAHVCVADYLRDEILPILASPPFGRIVTNKLSCQRPVFLFTEVHRDITVVGKQFKEDDSVPLDQAWKRAEREYRQLNLLQQQYGMRDGPDRVVTPYGKNRCFSALLVMQLAPGRMLDHYISEAVRGGHDQLTKRLGYLARFFSKLHCSSQTDTSTSPTLAHQYFDKLISGLANGPLSDREKDSMEEYALLWWNRDDLLTTDDEVVVHGDATPTNFLFHHEEVTGIDVERTCQADRCWDLGFMAAELKHHFMWRLGDAWAAEPFIRHFLDCYSSISGRDHMFETITRRLPLYMALGLMRIARNTWLDNRYRTVLLREARRCLKYGLSSSTTTGRW